MIPEVGFFAIILAFCFALLQACAPVWGYYRHNSFYFNIAKTAVVGQFVFLSFALLCLMACFIINDMSVIYVHDHSSQSLPFIYRMGATWGGHEGSLLLWCVILSVWMIAFRLFSSRHLPSTSFIKIIMILGFISSGFIAFLLLTSNPFLRAFPAVPVVGDDLTPVLQDPGLIFHPPMLYLGYVGFAIVFAFAICALMEGKLDATWAQACKPWIMLPWSLLGCGIVLGSWWAYRELGWGGWWFWDPVENASLLPWLAATALIHSLIVSEKRGVFKGWTLLLAIITFALSLLGTFLVRSGVLVSVHTFANDPGRGLFLLLYLTLIIGGALLLYSYRIKQFHAQHTFQVFSRETLLLINSIILLTAIITILLGTLYPILLDTFDLGKISIGEPYFNVVFIPIILPLLFLMGLAPHINWKQQAGQLLLKKLNITFFISVFIGLISPKLLGFDFHWLASLGIIFAVWIILATGQFAFTKNITLNNAAMISAHLGIAILALGIACNKSYSIERQVKMSPGESVTLAGYQFTFDQIAEAPGPNYQSILATFHVQKGTGAAQALTAEQRIYSHEQLLNKTAIQVNPWRDLYLALGSALPHGAWSVRIYYKPFVRWIWCGGFILTIGGILSLLSSWKRRELNHAFF